jgi:cytochrome c oxidase subunit 2
VKKTKQLLAGLALAFLGKAQADWETNLPVGVTETSRDIHGLHMLILWICVGIGVVVYGVLIYSLMHHRKSKGAIPAKFHENTKLEIVWTIIPFLILFGMAIPATSVMIKAYDASGADMSIKVTGYQWKWRYTYLDEGIDFFSVLDAKSNEARQLGSKIDPSTVEHYLLNVDKPLVIPVNKKVRILITSADVIHAWWVPEFGWKKDAIPGFVTDGWVKVEKPGVYRGQCTELCGRDHGFMPIVVEVKSEEDYQRWVADRKGGKQAAAAATDAAKTYALDELVAKGQEVYNANCAACHMADGAGMAGVFPAIKGSAVAAGPLQNHVEMVLKGKGAMPGFAGALAPLDLAAVITFQRNGFGNNKGDSIQPSEILANK